MSIHSCRGLRSVNEQRHGVPGTGAGSLRDKGGSPYWGEPPSSASWPSVRRKLGDGPPIFPQRLRVRSPDERLDLVQMPI